MVEVLGSKGVRGLGFEDGEEGGRRADLAGKDGSKGFDGGGLVKGDIWEDAMDAAEASDAADLAEMPEGGGRFNPSLDVRKDELEAPSIG